MRRWLPLLFVLLWAGPLWAQVRGGTPNPSDAAPVICVKADGSGFESCGGSGASGPTATEAATIAGGQSSVLGMALLRLWDGATYVRAPGDATAGLKVQFNAAQHTICDSGCSSSAGFADNSAFTYGTTAINPIGGVLDDVGTNTATENSAAIARITAQKALHINLRNVAGTEIGTAATPVQVSLANTGANATAVKTDGSAVTQPVSGTFWQATQPVSGTFWQATQPVSGTFWQATQPVSVADGSSVTLGAKADARSTSTDTTAITLMQVMKEISFMEQAPASRAVTNAGTFATQSAITAASGSIASGAIASGAIASGAIASGAVASGAFASGSVASGAYASGSIADGAMVTIGAKADAKSTATDTTAITIMQVLKEISAMVQAPAALPANQSVNQAQVGGTAVVAQPCQEGIPVTVAISQTTNTKLITQTSAKTNYLCGIFVQSADAENLSVVEGTGSTCGTSTAAVIGATTAANGPNGAANGGWVVPFQIKGTGTNLDLCLFQSGSGRVAGVLEYVQF